MGRLPDELYEPMKDATRLYFARAMAEGEVRRFLATAASDPDSSSRAPGSSSGRRCRDHAFRPADRRLTSGPQALVVNVTPNRNSGAEGCANCSCSHVLDAARSHGAGRSCLHASDAARPLYEKLGFRSRRTRCGSPESSDACPLSTRSSSS